MIVNPHPRTPVSRVLLGSALALCLVATCWTSTAGADDFRPGKLRFENYVPDDCYLYMSYEGLAACDAALEGTGIYKTWIEPEMQDFVRDMVGMVRGKLQEHPMHDHVRQVRAALQGRIGVAVGDLTIVAMRMPTPAFVIGVDTGNRTDGFQRLLHEVLGEMTGATGIEPESFTHRGHTIHAVAIPQAPRTHVCFTQVDNLFLVGLNKYYLERVLDNIAKGGESGLSAAPAYRRSVAHVGSGTSLMSFYVNIDGMKKKLRGITPPEIVEIAEHTGLAGVNAIYGASTVDGVGARDVWYIDSPGEKRGLMKVAAASPIGDRALRLAPYETVYFADMRFDLAGAVDQLLALADTFWPPARRQFDQFRERFRQQAGFDVYTDGIATLGRGMSWSISMPSTGGLVPEMLATIELADPAKFEKSMQRLLGLAGGDVRSLDYNGERLTYMSLGPQIPFTPTYAISGSTLYLAGAPLLLKEAMRNQGGGGKSLADNPKFQKVASRLKSTPSSLEYVDVPRAVALLYATGAPFLQGLQGRVSEKNIPIDLAMLPTTDALTRNLTGMARAYGSDQHGLYSETYSPVGLATALAVAARVINSLEGTPDPRLIAGAMPNVRARQAHAQAMKAEMEARHAQEAARREHVRAADAPPPAGSIQAEEFAEGVREAMAAAKGRTVFQQAFQAHTAGDYAKSIPGFLQAAELGFERSTCYYNIACGYSLQQQTDQAFAWLEKAVAAGFDNRQLLRSDADLNHIRSDARFKKYMQL